MFSYCILGFICYVKCLLFSISGCICVAIISLFVICFETLLYKINSYYCTMFTIKGRQWIKHNVYTSIQYLVYEEILKYIMFDWDAFFLLYVHEYWFQIVFINVCNIMKRSEVLTGKDLTSRACQTLISPPPAPFICQMLIPPLIVFVKRFYPPFLKMEWFVSNSNTIALLRFFSQVNHPKNIYVARPLPQSEVVNT